MATMTVDALRQVPYLAPLDPKILQGLAPAVRLRTYAAGEIILSEGDPCDGLYFIVRGRVKVFKTSMDGKEQILRILGPGRTFNDVPVFDGGPNPGSVAGLETSVIGRLPAGYMLSLVETQPTVAMAVIRNLASRMRALTILVEDLSLRGVVARVAKRLLECARGDHTMVEGSPGACARLTQHELAAMTGSVREVVQRALKNLEQDGAIRMERARIVILDHVALERWSESSGPGT